MASDEFFPQRPLSDPRIYAYEDSNPDLSGLLKIGYTTIAVEQRVAQQYPINRPKQTFRIVFSEPAIRNDGTVFSDHDIHQYLIRRGFENVAGEWFRCTVDDLQAAYIAVKNRTENREDRTRDFKMRPEQEQAVRQTVAYFRSIKEESPNKSPKFLWNAKMRFGKTFAAYQLAKQMGFKRVLILTFKPAVESAWREDLMTHVDFDGWQFICNPGSQDQPDINTQYERADKSRPIVCFGSFQDFLGINKDTGGIKPKNEWVHTTNWDIVIFDEYHFGAWKERAKSLFEKEDEEEFYNEEPEKSNTGNEMNESFLPITASYYLYLSGTPFRALNSGEFIEEQIYNWTYSDEQNAKLTWVGEDNPYACLPRMVMMTYRIPDSISEIAIGGEFDGFDLNEFFSAKGKGRDAQFKHEDYVQKWLDLIRGAYQETQIDELRLGAHRPPMPYSDTRLLNVLSHTLWFMPDVASCYAMLNLLRQRQNTFYHDYKIIVCAGREAGIGVKALNHVLEKMDNPLKTKTITLSCGKLTTGVTVKPWTAIFMLRNLNSPETYFQSAFRVQSPWEIDTESGRKEIMKHECYVFDFALERALRQISDYSCRLNTNEDDPEKKVREFINFLPVLAYDGSAMRPIDAGEILDITMAGTSATLLARRWESALLVNVDNETLSRLINNKEAMDALMRIEGFRNLNSEIAAIINKSEHVKKVLKEDRKLLPDERRQLSQEEKEYKSLRKQIQQKLIKFATRIPIFMYLTDYRERTLKDVITQLEPELFKKVTGLSIKDFELLISLNVFNASLMNESIYLFRRYENSSLEYTGINRHEGESIGLFDTVIPPFEELYKLQQSSMTPQPHSADDIPSDTYVTDNEIEDEEDVYFATRNEDDLPTRVAEERAPIVPPIMSAPVQNTSAGKAPSIFDPASVKVGMTVYHNTYGSGLISAIDSKGTRITVSFGGELKIFPHPNAFLDGFLRLDSGESE